MPIRFFDMFAGIGGFLFAEQTADEYDEIEDDMEMQL